ncbi:MAG: MlaD family protein [Candidatus Eremiobacteraeota bacterium]|nr:MlaD family protein [Candidatus Eremiobacteraeota bacterium]
MWIIPLVAVLVGLYLVVHALRTQGPTIEIQFKTAEGLEAGKTKIKYKNVDIGTVQTITLGPEKKGVVVSAQMTRSATDLLVDDTRFWIVKPRIAGGQISGLTTLLSGSYIGMDVGKSTDSRREFVGLDTQPAVTTDEPGREFLLHAADIGSLDIGSPVFFRRFQVGEVTAIQLDPDGKGVTALVFVHSPNEKYVTQNTRFWQASGIDVTIDGNGVKLSTQSLVSVVVGGIAFQTPSAEAAGPQAANDTAFILFDNERMAMKRSESQLEKYIAYFTDSIRGLNVGAPVEFRGYVVGEVRAIDMEFDRDTREFRFPVDFVLYRDVLPARIGRADKNGKPIDLDEIYARAIEKRGLRAQLRSGNLLTGQKYLALDFVKNAAPVKLPSIKDKGGARIIPTVPGTLDELQESIANIAKKVEKIPFDQLAGDLHRTLQQLQTTMKGADKLLSRVTDEVAPELAATLGEVRKTMKNAETVLSSDAPVQQDLRGTLTEVNRAAASLRLLTDYLQRHPESLLRGKAADVPLGGLPSVLPAAPRGTPASSTPSSVPSTAAPSGLVK